MERKIEIALLIGIVVVLGFILIFYKDKVQDNNFIESYNEKYEFNKENISSSTSNNQPQKVGTVTVKSGETNRVDIKEV